MPTWGQLLNEILRTKNVDREGPDFDGVRRKYLAELHALTGRHTIVYATAFLESRAGIAPGDLQVHLIDIQGFMECIRGSKVRQLDLIVHSPGGSAEAAESIVSYLRSKFDHIRVIVPLAAMSAATMISLAADEIIMGRHSQLGPIDPQFVIITPEGPRSAPGQAILDQFELAKKECKNDPAVLAAWVPILRSYAPGLLAQCKDQQELGKRIVGDWLKQFMFRGQADAERRGLDVAAWFGDYGAFKSHGRPVRIEHLQAEPLRLNAKALEDDQRLQDAVLAVHHATMHTLSATGAVKLIENHEGKAFVKAVGLVAVQRQLPPISPGGQPAQGINRADRRRMKRGR